ncbi:hypothetical protein GCM10020358_63190 [Amorphoplanes nipponensis]|uniref:hypothetical protein n=1 Tax=Actinoplanes nipponensis TaxID=135950 RepID=UPI0031E8F7DA
MTKELNEPDGGVGMVIVDEAVPADIVDRLLWQDAQQMLRRHVEPATTAKCVLVRLALALRSAPARGTGRARVRARGGRRWTLRHDLNSVRAMPGAVRHGRQHAPAETPKIDRTEQRLFTD